jgi:hypothetical protein
LQLTNVSYHIYSIIEFVPISRHSIWFIKPNHLMLCREKIAVISEIYRKHKNVFCVENSVFLSVKLSGTLSEHWNLNGSIC